MKQPGLAGAAVAVLLVMLCGCRVNRTQDGDGKNVRLETPFGGMSVKTGGAGVQAKIGLPVYPGATPQKKEDGDGGAADVRMNFGSFHLGVEAVSYTTPATPDQVMQFYRGQMARYGTVIECRGKQPVGSPDVTGEGLRCDEGSNGTVEREGHDGVELKTGSRTHQRVVGITPQGSGTRFALVLLDLPGGSGDGSEDRQ